MSKTSAGLIRHCKDKLGTPYVYGAKGEVLTQAILDRLARENPGTYIFIFFHSLATPDPVKGFDIPVPPYIQIASISASVIGSAQVPSPHSILSCFPAAGAGTSPAPPAALAVAALKAE